MLKRNTLKKCQKQRKGQSTVEYVILVAAVIMILVAFLTPDKKGFKKGFEDALKKGTNGIEGMANRFSTSHGHNPIKNAALKADEFPLQ